MMSKYKAFWQFLTKYSAYGILLVWIFAGGFLVYVMLDRADSFERQQALDAAFTKEAKENIERSLSIQTKMRALQIENEETYARLKKIRELPPEEEAFPDCGFLPTKKPGDSTFRVSSWKQNPKPAEEARAAIASVVQNDYREKYGKPSSNLTLRWTPKLQQLDTKWYVVFQKADPTQIESVCRWLRCKGFFSGFEPCGALTSQGTLL